jgi:NitT/TauT family transport system permease protein
MSARLIRTLLWVAGTLVAWEIIVHLDWVSVIVLPAPSDVLAAGLKDGVTFLIAFGVTLGEIAVSIAIAWTLGILTGFVVGNTTRMSVVTASILSSLFAVPLVIIYPLFMAWLGIGSLSKIAFGVLSGYFPIALNVINGVRAIDPSYTRMARAMGASSIQIFTQVVLPLAIPSIISGLRIGTGLIVIGVIVAEMLASRDGIGFLISYHRTLLDTGHVYLGFVFVIALAVGVNRGLSLIEGRFGSWNRAADSLTAAHSG